MEMARFGAQLLAYALAVQEGRAKPGLSATPAEYRHWRLGGMPGGVAIVTSAGVDIFAIRIKDADGQAPRMGDAHAQARHAPAPRTRARMSAPARSADCNAVGVAIPSHGIAPVAAPPPEMIDGGTQVARAGALAGAVVLDVDDGGAQ